MLRETLHQRELPRLLEQVGFRESSVEPARGYQVEDARRFLTEAGLDVEALAPPMKGRSSSA